MEFNILIVLLLIGVVCFVALQLLQTRSTRYGSAKLLQSHSILKRRNKGLVVDGVRSISVKDSCNHMLVVSPSGSGKSTTYSIPNLLRIDSSMVITDVKGELYDLTANHLKDKGFAVRVLDLENIEHSLRFNPLKRIDEESIKAFSETLYDMSNEKASEGIWKQGACTIIAVILHCLKNAENGRYANMANLIHILKSINVSTKGKEVNSFFATYCPDDEIFNMYRSWINQDEKISGGQLSGALAALAPFDSKSMRSLTSEDTIDFSELRKRKTAFFIKVPVAKSEEYAPLLTLFYSQLFAFLHEREPTKDEQTIFIIMEEFANMLMIPRISSAISLLRSYSVSVSIVLQNIEQMQNIYGKETAETITSNCASQIVYPGLKSEQTLRKLEYLMGTATHEETDTKGRKHTNARKVLNSDEIRRLPKGKGLFLHGNLPPILLQMRPIYKNRSLMRKAGITSKNGRLVSKRPPLKMPHHPITEVEYVELEPPPKGNTDVTLELKAMEKLNKFNERN